MKRNGTGEAPVRGAQPRVVFAGDRDIAVRVLQFLMDQGVRPLALLLPSPERASHGAELRALCAHLNDSHVLEGPAFREAAGIRLLRALRADWIVGIHFPLLVPDEVLRIPRYGVLNLHPALLPWNRGWHTPSWAILEGTPVGATLHFMSAELDGGDIVAQKELNVSPGDTAHALYGRLKELEYEVFREAWPGIAAGDVTRSPQQGEGTAHRRSELLSDRVRRIDPDERLPAGELLRKLRALTTNRFEEAAFFDEGGVRYRVRVEIDGVPVPASDASSTDPR